MTEPTIEEVSVPLVVPGRAIHQSEPADPAMQAMIEDVITLHDAATIRVAAQTSLSSEPEHSPVKTFSPLMAPETPPMLPDDPARPMMGTIRLAGADTMAAVPHDAVTADPDLASNVPDDESGCAVAVVVPMSRLIDEPVIPLTAPSRLETRTGVAACEPPVGGRAGIELDPAGDAVPARSPKDVVGSPFILGGTESRTVAEAGDRLMDQLGHLAADHGGALDDLDRVHAAVASTDGSRYEMAVERAGGHD